jgi:hypothetical protein
MVMSHITLDAATAQQLKQAKELIEVRDPSGHVIGHFTPEIDPSAWELVGHELTEEEEERIYKEDKWYTFEEVMAHLKRLEQE